MENYNDPLIPTRPELAALIKALNFIHESGTSFDHATDKHLDTLLRRYQRVYSPNFDAYSTKPRSVKEELRSVVNETNDKYTGMKILKLRNLIESVDQAIPTDQKEWTTEEKKAALESIGRYNEYGGHLRREHNLMEIAHTLSKITEAAERFTLSETDEWFDKKTISENMKQLRRFSEEFNKLAKEAHTTQQRMEALYEDGGHVLSRYFEIKDLTEGVSPAVSKLKNNSEKS